MSACSFEQSSGLERCFIMNNINMRKINRNSKTGLGLSFWEGGGETILERTFRNLKGGWPLQQPLDKSENNQWKSFFVLLAILFQFPGKKVNPYLR